MEDKHLFLAHYGVSVDKGAPGRGSGRYPKGSGERPFQRDKEKQKELREKYSDLAWQEDDVRIKKGSKVYNISVGTPREISEGVFISTNQADRALYNYDHGDQYLRWQHPDSDLYDNEFTLKKDLVSPGIRARRDYFMQMAKENPEKMADYLDYGKDKTVRYLLFFKKHVHSDSPDMERWMKLGEQEIRRLYPDFQERFGANKDTFNWGRSEYVKRLQADGYNSMIDDNDVGYSNAPMIVFNGRDILGSRKSTLLDPEKENERRVLYESYNW